MNANLNFVRGQGFTDTTPASCGVRYPALMFQPRALMILVILGILVDASWWFVGLGVILVWNVLVPRHNPFDIVYYHAASKRRREPRIAAAPAPRRFAQAIAALFMFAVAYVMRRGNHELAWTLQLLLLFFIGLLVFARFCVGSYIYYLVTRQAALARQVLPWTRTR